MATRPPARRQAAAAAIVSALTVVRRVILRWSAMWSLCRALRASSTVHKLFLPCCSKQQQAACVELRGKLGPGPTRVRDAEEAPMPYRSPVADILFSLNAVAG